jgi:hypothetical protein
VGGAQGSTRGWRPWEFLLLVFPVGAVLLAADEIGDRAPGERASAWAWFLATAAVAVVAGGWSGARSSLGVVDTATRRRSTILATYTALVGVAAGGLVGGGLPPVVAMGVASSFLLGWVIVRAVRVLRLRVATDRPS